MRSPIREKREAAGLTMTELSARIHMDLSKLSRLENGHLKLKAEDIPIIAQALGCDPAALLPTLEEVQSVSE